MKKCRFPTSLLDDFDSDLIQEAHSILSLPLPDIYSTLTELLDKKKKILLLCILRLLLDIPVNKSSTVLVGWFFNNGLVPIPTFYQFFHNLLLNASTIEGQSNLILFGESILPNLPKYCQICNYLLSIPSLPILNHQLYVAIYSISHDNVQFESIDCRKYHVIPKLKVYYTPVTKIDPPPAFLSNVPLIQPKPNIFASIEYAATLPPDEQRLYCVNLCLTYSPPSVRLHYPPLLSSICAYTRLLLYDSNHFRWNAFEIHPQLERMGSWICTLSIEHGPPPPLHVLNITLLIRECAATGSLGHCLIFLNALFSRCSKIYMPPNPLTVSILSVLSACYHVSNLRTDIKKQIERFCSIFNTDIELYHFREIFIPSNSFDCSAQFIQTSSQTMFQSSTQIPLSSFYDTEQIDMNDSNANFNGEEVKIVDDPEVVNAYFHYVPNREMLPKDLQDLCANVERIEKYYFIDCTSHILRKQNPAKQTHENDQELLQCFVSLALADSPILAKTAARLFKKKTKSLTSSIDLCPLFRCAFPNRYILAACLERKCFAPEDVNSLFSELLTNQQTAPIVRPMISSFMSMCFQFCPGYSFTSTCDILGINRHKESNSKNNNNNNDKSINFSSNNNSGNQSKNKSNSKNSNKNKKQKSINSFQNATNSNSHIFNRNRSLPPPLKMHASLLSSFLSYVTAKNEKTRSAFFQKVGDASVPQIISLVSFVFSVTKKQSKQSCSSKIDYSVIDELCFSLGKCANRIYSRNNDKFISNCYEVAKSISPEAPHLLLFRFVLGLFTHVHLKKNKEPMIELLERHLHPSKIPSFSICWLQLVMQRAALPYLITTNEERPMQFCLNFVITAMSLVVKIPEVFYRGVTRILLTIQATTPNFFASYHALLIEKLPLRFIQLRNIILTARDNDDSLDNFAPFVGFKFDDELKSKNKLVDAICNCLSPKQSKTEFNNNVKFISDVLTTSFKEETENEEAEDDVEYSTDDFNNFTIPKIFWQFVIFSFNESLIVLSSKNTNNSSEEIPITHLFVEIQKVCSNQRGTLFLLYNAIIDQLRYKNKHTTIASILIQSLFDKADDDLKELLIVCIIKRLLCVTQPPKSISLLFKQITLKYENDIQRILKQNGELQLFESAISVINSFTIRKSKSENAFP